MANIPPSFTPIVQPAYQFNNPVSENSQQNLGAGINAALTLLPVGSVIDSMLSETQFQSAIGTSQVWVLADGRNVAGSAYASLVGTSIPDFRGLFRRASNNGG